MNLTTPSEPVKFLSVDEMSFFVARFDDDFDEYRQYSIRMNFENAKRLCDNCRKNDPTGIYKVFADTEH